MTFDSCIERTARSLGLSLSTVAATVEPLRDGWNQFINPEVRLLRKGSLSTFFAPSLFRTRAIRAYDFDDTLLKRGTTELIDERRITEMISYSQKGNTLVILSNQKGLSLEGERKLASRLSFLFDKLGFRIPFLAALADDHFRKPNIGMLEKIVEEGIEPLESLVYIGDAAGRPGDFSDSDRKMLENFAESHPSVQCQFQTPEEESSTFSSRLMVPLSLRVSEADYFRRVNALQKEIRELSPVVILMVGFPGSGKSTLGNHLAETVVSFDDGKGPAKRLLDSSIREGKNVVVANCSLSLSSRKEIIDRILPSFSVLAVRMVDSNHPFGDAWNLNVWRAGSGGRKVPRVAYSVMAKKLVEPSVEELSGSTGRKVRIREFPIGIPIKY